MSEAIFFKLGNLVSCDLFATEENWSLHRSFFTMKEYLYNSWVLSFKNDLPLLSFNFQRGSLSESSAVLESSEGSITDSLKFMD